MNKKKYKLLDLYCGAGGCSVGYSRAGFDVVGVDHKRFKRYPFEQIVADAWEVLHDYVFLQQFDVIHASPVSKFYSRMTPKKYKYRHPDDITSVRAALVRARKPYIIENVPGSPLVDFLKLDGNMFGLKVHRERWFECRPLIMFPPMDGGYRTYGLVSGSFESSKLIGVYGKGFRVADARMAMGIDWMTGAELVQAIPPAYTEFIGKTMINILNEPY